MKERLLSLWIVLTILVVTCFSINAQGKGQLSVDVKSQGIPLFGTSYGISDKVLTRLLVYFDFSGGDFIYSIMSDFSFQIKLSGNESLSTYMGQDITYIGFIDKFYLGMIFGVESKINQKLSIYGEFGPSLGIGDGIESINFLNTGVGIKYYLK